MMRSMNGNYVPTIGLEIHAELKTNTKMFCSSKNDANETRPNVNICPVCLAHPGTLPVINREAVRQVLRVGVALDATLADYTEFDRKNYFYPDLPKGYQISQYAYPLVSGGSLKGIAITRVHLEEDTASSIHDGTTGETLIDYNRAGMPLMELVTEPVIHSAKEAGDFGRELQLLLRYLGASDADMEKGEMRLEANISVAKASNDQETRNNNQTNTLGTKVEVKNINSFRAMERAVLYEIKRQTELLESGGVVVQETRGWDEGKQSTFPQRIKEGSADYRYFPDPDLPSLTLSNIAEFSRDKLAEGLPELPKARRERYMSLGVKEIDAEQLTAYPELGAFLDEVCSSADASKDSIYRAANYITNDLVSIIRGIADRDTELQDDMPISAKDFAKIMLMIEKGVISSRVAKDLLVHTIEQKKDPEVIAGEMGLLMSGSLGDLEKAVDEVLLANPKVVADYKSGKESALQFLIGQGMKAMKGAVDPTTLRNAILEKIAK